MIRRLVIALAGLALMFASAAAAPLRPAGYVVALDAPEDAPAPVLRRQGEALDVQVWRELFDGDVLEVAGKAVVTIETAKDKRLAVDAARAPHRISGELAGGGRFAALAATLGELFRAKPDAAPANLVGRNDAAPRLRMGQAAAPQVVVAGAAVWARWQGGTPPFTVEITRPSRPKRALAAATAETREARLDVPAQAAGRLTLVIRDAAGLEARAPLRAQAAPPPTPEWIAAGAPTPEMRQLAAAAHLLGDDKRRYQLLAAGMAAELGSAPARALLDIIARGDRSK